MKHEMEAIEIDERAKEKAIKDYGFPPCIHVPIAAIDEDSIKRFIGEIVDVLVPGMPNKALVVQPYCVIRSKATSESGASRPPNPEYVVH